jgi:hypothetical protein
MSININEANKVRAKPLKSYQPLFIISRFVLSAKQKQIPILKEFQNVHVSTNYGFFQH